jgi:predicted outer membrane repeat protein
LNPDADIIEIPANTTITLSAVLPTINHDLTIRGAGLTTIIQGKGDAANPTPEPAPGRLLESLHNSELSCHNHRFQKRLRPVCDQDRASQQKPLPDQWLRKDHRQLCSDSNDFVRLDVDESTFEGNTAGLMPESMGGSGGAIYTQKASLWVTDTLFTNNSSATLGGAIFVDEQSWAFVERSAFNLNKSGNPLQLHSVFIALGGGYLDDVVTIYLDSNPIWGN